LFSCVNHRGKQERNPTLTTISLLGDRLSSLVLSLSLLQLLVAPQSAIADTPGVSLNGTLGAVAWSSKGMLHSEDQCGSCFFVVVLAFVFCCEVKRLHQRTFILFRSQDGAWSVYPYRVAGASAGAVRRGSQHTPPGKNIRNFVALIIREFDCFWYVRLLSRTNYQNQCTYV